MGRCARIGFSICLIVGMVVVLAPCGPCGSLDDPAGPTDPASAMYTIEDIYKLLNGDTSVAKRTGAFTEPASGPTSGTGHTLDDVMDLVKHRSHVRKTGQTICYNTAGTVIECAGTGQDGDFQKGVASPSPRFTDNNDGTVTDNLTRLIWLKNANCPNAKNDWTSALSYVSSLNSAGTMNGNNCSDTSNIGSHQTDWRLPNVNELLSLIDWGRLHPSLPFGYPFTNVNIAAYYWSSNANANGPSWAWFVYLTDGTTNVASKTTTNGCVFPVRGGQ